MHLEVENWQLKEENAELRQRIEQLEAQVFKLKGGSSALLGISAAAKYLHISTGHLHECVKTGELVPDQEMPPQKLKWSTETRHRYLFSQSTLDAFRSRRAIARAAMPLTAPNNRYKYWRDYRDLGEIGEAEARTIWTFIDTEEAFSLQLFRVNLLFATTRNGRKREMWLLRKLVAGVKASEIARELGVTNSNVYTTRNSILRHMRACIRYLVNNGDKYDELTVEFGIDSAMK